MEKKERKKDEECVLISTIFFSSNFQQYFHGSLWFQGHCLWTATDERVAHITAE